MSIVRFRGIRDVRILLVLEDEKVVETFIGILLQCYIRD
jgi:hypothetical protein